MSGRPCRPAEAKSTSKKRGSNVRSVVFSREQMRVHLEPACGGARLDLTHDGRAVGREAFRSTFRLRPGNAPGPISSPPARPKAAPKTAVQVAQLLRHEHRLH